MEYPSQRDHDCLTMPVEERVELLFNFLFIQLMKKMHIIYAWKNYLHKDIVLISNSYRKYY